ncbi:MAG TPA: inositol monophosphatase family protein, partial [Candidatus Sulfotelmatobacter sp.]|nr:inositol monophosphatase family protein [Candidatus Sulfotelmatobacter sp.]
NSGTVETKGFGDYVTAVDHAAEDAAVAVVTERTPDIPVLAEERGGSLAERVWVIDPVDGTTNFVRRFPMVGVSAAVLQDGVPVAGAVAAPFLGETWSAARGGGARDKKGRPLAIASSEGKGVVATGFPFRNPANLSRYLPVMNTALDEFEDLRRPGAASLDLAYVAAGVWDGFFELGLAVWDIAAGALLILEAGGVVTDWEGDRLEVYTSGDILAGAPAWHETMLRIVRETATLR